MEVKRVLWPTDFSKNAASALPVVKSLTQKYDAEIHLLYVAHISEDLVHHDHWYGELDSEHAQKLEQWELDMAEKRLSELCDNSLEGCPRFIRKIVSGDPAAEILKAVKEDGIDMIVLCTHGEKGHFPFGSVAERVVRNSPVPVVTVNPN